jgi:hypothetical protein
VGRMMNLVMLNVQGGGGGGVYDVTARLSQAIGAVACSRGCDSPHGSIPGEVPPWMMQRLALFEAQRIAKPPPLIRELYIRSVHSGNVQLWRIGACVWVYKR